MLQLTLCQDWLVLAYTTCAKYRVIVLTRNGWMEGTRAQENTHSPNTSAVRNECCTYTKSVYDMIRVIIHYDNIILTMPDEDDITSMLVLSVKAVCIWPLKYPSHNSQHSLFMLHVFTSPLLF